MHRLYTAAVWGSLGLILVGLSMVFGAWAVGAVVAGICGAYGILYLAQRGGDPQE
jgi:hypothetical protein